MSLTFATLETLESHWAMEAVGKDNLKRAKELVHERLARNAVGGQIDFVFESDDKDESLFDRVTTAFEFAAIEGLDALSRDSEMDVELRNQCIAASFNAFEMRRLLPLPNETHDRLFSVLRLCAGAYCGERWSDLRRWCREHDADLTVPSVADVEWDIRLLYRLFDCWVRLFRKGGWDDLNRVPEIIVQLRDEQEIHENQVLSGESAVANKAKAFRLVALYHWAKGTEILATYMLQGEPASPKPLIDKHFEAGIASATACADMQTEFIMRWLHACSRIMISNSLWWATRGINSKTTQFVRSLTSRKHRPMFELMPPQRQALLEQGLLDQAKTAIVVDMPTSGGKTLLAQFRMLQALNQFEHDGGWIAYVAPTRALSAQITRRLRKDFEPIGVRVEQLTAAVEVDAYEEMLLNETKAPFNILVATPEKLALVVRNKKVERPLVLAVMDEAHNIETEGRGLRIELLLATIKRDCEKAHFLLLMPYVEETDSIAGWLAHDLNAGKAISLSTTPWKPNERIIGLYSARADDSKRAGWRIEFETLTVTKKAMPLRGTHVVGDVKPIDVPKSQVLGKNEQTGLHTQTAAIGTAMSSHGTSVVVGTQIRYVWKMAEIAADRLERIENVSDDIKLVQDFLKTEISPKFQLAEMLDKGVGVHHAGLSDDVRTLMEWLAENGSLRMLCATSTISQGINFPISSIFLSSRFVYQRRASVEMAPREFWNLAGRTGRMGHDSIGVIGLAAGDDPEKNVEFVRKSTGALVSRLVTLLDDLSQKGELANLSEALWQDQWEDFRCYIAHLWAEKKNLDAVLSDSEQLLRQTYGYTSLRNDPQQREKAEALLKATRDYAHQLARMNKGVPELSVSTGFSPEGVIRAMGGIRMLEFGRSASDWTPERLFGKGGHIADLYGVMLKVPQLKRQLSEIGGEGFAQTRISDITRDWVNGVGIETIAKRYFENAVDNESGTAALTNACKAIYRNIVNSGTWGVSAISRVAGLDFDSLSDGERRRLNAVPAMIYHGVSTEEAVLMRMNAAPRSVAEKLGHMYRERVGDSKSLYSIGTARKFLKGLEGQDWNRVRPQNAVLSGDGYRRIWGVLSGESA